MIDLNRKIKLDKDIKSASKYSRTIKLYKNIDKEISKGRKTLNLESKCGKGCSECCHQIFNISEIEFCIIVDYVSNNFNKKQIENLFEKSNSIVEYLMKNDRFFYENLQSDITGGNVLDYLYGNFAMKKNVLPKSCVFLNDKNECSIYQMRPIICRTHGVSYLNKDYNNVLCSKISVTNDNRNKFVDLTSYDNEVRSLFIFKCDNKMILRRPYPIFYWFYFLNDNNMKDLNKFKKTLLYNRYVSLSESEMMNNFLEGYAN